MKTKFFAFAYPSPFASNGAYIASRFGLNFFLNKERNKLFVNGLENLSDIDYRCVVSYMNLVNQDQLLIKVETLHQSM